MAPSHSDNKTKHYKLWVKDGFIIELLYWILMDLLYLYWQKIQPEIRNSGKGKERTTAGTNYAWWIWIWNIDGMLRKKWDSYKEKRREDCLGDREEEGSCVLTILIGHWPATVKCLCLFVFDCVSLCVWLPYYLLSFSARLCLILSLYDSGIILHIFTLHVDTTQTCSSLSASYHKVLTSLLRLTHQRESAGSSRYGPVPVRHHCTVVQTGNWQNNTTIHQRP